MIGLPPPPPTSNKPSARRRQELIRHLGRLTEAQVALGWGVVLLLAALVGVIYVSQASHMASLGRHVQNLQNELTRLKRENVAIERQIAEAQSLERLQQEAIQKGFILAEPGDIEYIIVSEYPSIVDNLALEEDSESLKQPASPKTIGEATWLALKSVLNNLMEGSSSEQ